MLKINIETLTAAIIAAITRPQEHRRVTWEQVMLRVGKISRLTVKVIRTIEEDEPLVIEFSHDNRDIDEDRLVHSIIHDLRNHHE
jgi:hypothetical protein